MNRSRSIIPFTSISTWNTNHRISRIDSEFVCNPTFNKKVALWQGDITKLKIDCIVNAANKTLLGGGGVDGAIHAAAGPKLLSECEKLNGCKTGDAKITKGYKLPAKNVIHTVGPIGEKPDQLSSCYKTSLNLMKRENLKSIAFPCISTGIYGYPNLNAAHVVLKTVREWLEENNAKVDAIIFCLFLQKDIDIYESLMHVYFPLPNLEEGVNANEKNYFSSNKNSDHTEDLNQVSSKDKKTKLRPDNLDEKNHEAEISCNKTDSDSEMKINPFSDNKLEDSTKTVENETEVKDPPPKNVSSSTKNTSKIEPQEGKMEKNY